MTAPRLAIATLTPQDSSGGDLAAVPVRLRSAVTRTLETFGDQLILAVSPEHWPPEELDRTRPMLLRIGDDSAALDDPQIVELGGYYLVQESVSSWGGEPAASQEIVLRLITIFGVLRDGRGGLIREKVFNKLGRDGLVNTAHDDYRTNSELVEICLDALGIVYEIPLPETLDDFDAPGPLDWGQTRALPQLEDLLRRVGHAIRLVNGGELVGVVRLPRGGEEVSVPSGIDDDAEPYELSPTPGIKPTRIIVTSGRTRSTIVKATTLDDWNWVWFSSELGSWLDDADTAAIYPGTTEPGDIDAFKLGPPKDPVKRQEFNRLFAALQLKEPYFEKGKRIVPLPDEVTLADNTSISGVACVLLARCAMPLGNQFLRGTPVEAEGVRVRFDGATAVSDKGVIVLPSDAAFVRVASSQGAYQDATAMEGDDLIVVFAHEANTGDADTDFYTVGFVGAIVDDVLDVTVMTEEELEAAVLDSEVVVVEAPWLRRLMLLDLGETDPDPLNDDALEDAARTVAMAHLSAGLVQSGRIDVPGYINVEPGSWGGAVSSVTWDTSQARTIIMVNTHEVPGSVLDRATEHAHRSFATGLSRYSLPGSSIALSDVKSGGAPSLIVGDRTGVAPEISAAGAEDAAASREGRPAPVPGARAKAEDRWLAKITGAVSLGGNRWKYEWTQVRPTTEGVFAAPASPYTHANRGYAYNRCESFNASGGVQGNGIDVATLPTGFTLVPVGDSVVVMDGPYFDGDDQWCSFELPNMVDGECTETVE